MGGELSVEEFCFRYFSEHFRQKKLCSVYGDIGWVDYFAELSKVLIHKSHRDLFSLFLEPILRFVWHPVVFTAILFI